MDPGTYAGFAVAFPVFAASPGPDNLTIVSKAASEGAARGIAYGCGVVASIAGFVVLAALGFDALAGEHLRLVRCAGAAYLVYAGVAMWRAPAPAGPRALRGGLARPFGLGFLLSVSNPKMPIFYLALLAGPLGDHRLTPAEAAGLLASVVLVETLVIGAYVALALRARAALADPRRARAMNRGAGALMVGAGALVAAH